MALEGNLTDFGLSEILQLIAVQQKSGMLSITSQDRSMVIFFKNGKIISTRDRRRKSKDPLKDYLTRYGIISRKDLIKIMQISAQSKLDLTDIIVSEKFLSEEEMKKHFRNHIQEAVHEILTWKQCTYKFMPGSDIISSIKNWGEYGIEGVLMESMRRIDEFPQILEEFPDEGMMISRSRSSEEELEENEKLVFDLLNEARSMEYLIAHAKMPSFETYEALKHLKEKNMIMTYIPVEEAGQKQSKPTAKRSSFARHLIGLAPPVAVAIVFSASLWYGANKMKAEFKNITSTTLNSKYGGSYFRNRAEAHIRWLLEAYRAEHGKYPRSLAILTESGLASVEFMKRVESFSFRYHLTPEDNSYTLL